MRKLITILVILVIGFSAFWLVKGKSMFADSMFSGFYAEVTKATSGDLIRVLQIKNGGEVVLISDYGDKGFSRDSGTWSSSGTILSVYINSSKPHKIDFTKSRNGLIAVYYDEKIYGQFGLTMYRFWPESTDKSKKALDSVKINSEDVFHALLRGNWLFGIEPSVNTLFNISFRNNKISGQLCNSFSGSYVMEGTVITSEGLVSTKKACPGTEEMRIENIFLNSIREGLSVVFDKVGNAFLFSNSGERIDLIR